MNELKILFKLITVSGFSNMVFITKYKHPQNSYINDRCLPKTLLQIGNPTISFGILMPLISPSNNSNCLVNNINKVIFIIFLST